MYVVNRTMNSSSYLVFGGKDLRIRRLHRVSSLDLEVRLDIQLESTEDPDVHATDGFAIFYDAHLPHTNFLARYRRHDL